MVLDLERFVVLAECVKFEALHSDIALGEQWTKRARQNVIAELGWFAGRLGRNRVCALVKGKVELPSDFAGVGYVDMDPKGSWKREVAQELEAASFSTNWSDAMK